VEAILMLTPTHLRWKEFTQRLGGPEGCNFRDGKNGLAIWNCGGRRDQSLSRKILGRMGFLDGEIEDTLEYFTEHGGHCDCEILFNVDSAEDEAEAGG
jgi:hypothetical protein